MFPSVYAFYLLYNFILSSLDFYSEQAPSGADGRSDSQSFPYIQRLNHPAAAVERAHQWYVSTVSDLFISKHL